MRQRFMREQAGQTLALVAVLMVALLAFLAIAIDVGHIYRERGLMQNAADAGALAGAREICFGNPDLAEAQAQQYALDNGAQVADVSIVDWVVTVTTTEVTDLFVAGIVGMHTADVGAVAEASCGAATSACGLWPIAFSEERWLELYNDGNGCGTDFFVWHGDNTQQIPDCTVYYCDCFPDNNGNGKCDLTDGEGIQDIMGEEARAYVDFSGALSPEYPDPEGCDQGGCGTNELACWITNDSGAMIEIGSCIPDLGGVRTAVKQEVESRIDDAINVPIYDTMNQCEADFGSDCTQGDTYHVSGFACTKPKAYLQNWALPRLDGANPPWKGNIIRVQVNCAEECQTNCGGTGGEPPPPWAVRAVSLTR